MNDEKKKILELLASGKINADEAERLLDALGEKKEFIDDPTETSGKKPKFMCVQVDCDPDKHNGRENVNIKVPLILLKTGMKFKSLMPEKARVKIMGHMSEKGLDFDLDKLDAAKLDEFISVLAENSIDIDSDHEKIRIFCC